MKRKELCVYSHLFAPLSPRKLINEKHLEPTIDDEFECVRQYPRHSCVAVAYPAMALD